VWRGQNSPLHEKRLKTTDKKVKYNKRFHFKFEKKFNRFFASICNARLDDEEEIGSCDSLGHLVTASDSNHHNMQNTPVFSKLTIVVKLSLRQQQHQ